MKNLFIDTNVYLTFYHFSSDDLEELKKLSVAVKNGNIKLFITEQVVNEFKRNRESKIADALNMFSNQKLPDQFPQISKTYEEYKQLRTLLKSFSMAKDQLIIQLKKDIDNKTCVADTVINELFEVAKKLEINEDILSKAKNRVLMGNPPGKDNSYGDSINWELLLGNVYDGEDLYLVTEDKDYSSKIENSKLSEFLDYEWNNKKGSNIFFYRKLSDFLNNEFPNIKLATELEKELAINSFISSPNFATTHLAIEKLTKFTDYSSSEVVSLIEASIHNNQIYWINDDDDVNSFLKNLIKGKEYILESEIIREFERIYGTNETRADDIPF